ncbi:MAG: hypothetical protein II837_00515 [Treponema sp.]|nr:hypothetical protein [Treponema sp.]MBQ6566706.1 hypothetical protein [Treponema sp.]
MKLMTELFHAFILPVLLVPLFSCENGDVSELLRTYDDPSDATPRVDSYSDPYTVRLSWNPDEAADTFILLRAPDNGLYSFTEVYRGTGTNYTDSFTGMEGIDRYLYRLDKTRGQRTFTGSSYACAVSSMSENDLHEDNDVCGRATELEISLSATMPCARFVWEGKAIYDVDWYYVDVPAHRTATVLVEQTDSGRGAASADTDFLWMEEGGVWSHVASNTPFKLTNRSHERRKLRFVISPNLTQVFPGGTGTRVLAYTITLREIE